MTIANINDVSLRSFENTLEYDTEAGVFVLPADIVPDVQMAIAEYCATGKDALPLENREDGTASMSYGHLDAVIGGLRLVWRSQRDVPELAARTWQLGRRIGFAALSNQQEAALAMWRLSQEIALNNTEAMLLRARLVPTEEISVV